jgi:glucose/mannose transport system permease protein
MKDNTSNPWGPRPKKLFTPSRIMIYSVLFVAAVYYLIPLYIMIMTSLKGMPEIRLGNIFSPPMELTFEPWVKAWDTACTGLHCEGVKVGFWNSVRILIPSVIVSTIIASINGYGLSNWRFKGSEFFFAILLFGAFIPYQVLIYPIAMILKTIGVYGSLTTPCFSAITLLPFPVNCSRPRGWMEPVSGVFFSKSCCPCHCRFLRFPLSFRSPEFGTTSYSA